MLLIPPPPLNKQIYTLLVLVKAPDHLQKERPNLFYKGHLLLKLNKVICKLSWVQLIQ